MAVAPYKTYIPLEVLTYSDLNNSFLQIHNNGDDLASPATKAHDMNGFAIFWSASGEVKTLATSNRIFALYLGGLQFFRWEAAASAVDGLGFVATASGTAPYIAAEGISATIDINLVPKSATGVVLINGTPIHQHVNNVLSARIFG